MNQCQCKRVYQIEDSYIPGYGESITAGGPEWKAVEQYECIVCGKRWGYLGIGVELIEKPKVLRVG